MGLDARTARLRTAWHSIRHGDLPDRLWTAFAAILDARGLDPDALRASAGEEPRLPAGPHDASEADECRARRRAWSAAVFEAEAPVREAYAVALRGLYDEAAWGSIPHGPRIADGRGPGEGASFAWVEVAGARISLGEEYAERRRDRTLRVAAIEAGEWGAVEIVADVVPRPGDGPRAQTRLLPRTLLRCYRRVGREPRDIAA